MPTQIRGSPRALGRLPLASSSLGPPVQKQCKTLNPSLRQPFQGRGFLSVLNLISVWQFRASPVYPLDQAQLEPKSPPPRVNTQAFYSSSVHCFVAFLFSFRNSSSYSFKQQGLTVEAKAV